MNFRFRWDPHGRWGVRSVLRLALAFLLIAGPTIAAAAQESPRAGIAVPPQVAEVACGQCQFGMPGPGCDLAVRIAGSTFFVDGSGIDDHGDAHAETGLCNCIRQAWVAGRIVDGRLVVEQLQLFPPPGQEPSSEVVLERVWNAVRDRFYRADFHGVDWERTRDEFLPSAVAAKSSEELAAVIDTMLARLQTSHTHFYTRADVEYYFLSDIFSAGTLAPEILPRFPQGVVRYEGIGVFTRQVAGQWFVVGAPDGGPAAQAGLRRGHQIISVNGKPFEPVQSFVGLAGQPVELVVQSTPNPESRRVLTVATQWIRPQEFMLQAMNDSMRLIEARGQKIGYVRVWSYAGSQFQESLVEAIARGIFSQADGLIMDLRDGWGGADPEYLQMFNQAIPRMTVVGRDGAKSTFDRHWRKPCVLLINEGTRSGKELIAYGFKKSKIGPVVGTRTAGAVTAGTLIPVSPEALLYLAVSGIEVDGEILEGRGVEPDHQVAWELPFAAEADPQLERAIDLLTHRSQ